MTDQTEETKIIQRTSTINEGASAATFRRFNAPGAALGRIAALIGDAKAEYVTAQLHEEVGKVVGTLLVFTENAVVRSVTSQDQGEVATTVEAFRRSSAGIELKGDPTSLS